MNSFVRKKRKGKLVGFNDIIPDIISEYQLEKLFTIELLQSIWLEMVGDIISTHSIPEHIQHGVLYVGVDHSVYGNELIMNKDYIISKIAEQCPFSRINSIRVTVKKLQWKMN